MLGHWLVTGLVLAGDGGLHQASPLASLPDLAPVTWVLQTLGLFFFTAGFGSTRSLARYPGGAGGWLTGRLRRLLLPTVALLGVGAAVLLTATVVGTSDDTLAVALRLAVSPLWFLLPLVILVALTGPLRVAVRRWGVARCGAPAVVVVAAVDLAVRLLPAGTDLPPVTVLAAWSVPYLLGVAHADGRLDGRRAGGTVAAGGAVALAALLALGYPVSAVGVPGAGVSNLNPPSLLVVALAVTQVGLGLLARPGAAPAAGPAAAGPSGDRGEPVRRPDLPVAPAGTGGGDRAHRPQRARPARSAHRPGRPGVGAGALLLAAAARRGAGHRGAGAGSQARSGEAYALVASGVADRAVEGSPAGRPSAFRRRRRCTIIDVPARPTCRR